MDEYDTFRILSRFNFYEVYDRWYESRPLSHLERRKVVENMGWTWDEFVDEFYKDR